MLFKSISSHHHGSRKGSNIKVKNYKDWSRIRSFRGENCVCLRACMNSDVPEFIPFSVSCMTN
jgi:hypothetical protein